MNIAFIGLGSMGTPMARNLMSAGFPLAGYDLNSNAVAAFAANGGKPAVTSQAAAAGADAVILMVVNAAQAEQALFEGGVLDALAPAGTVVLMATCPPGAVKTMAARVEKTGRSFLDAPVSGGVAGAEAATLSIMVGAPKAAFERMKPVLRARDRALTER